MSKVKSKHPNYVPGSIVKEIHNPFVEVSQSVYRERQTKKSPKHPKRTGKCFQLVLICQKLLKPFSSLNKVPPSEVTKSEISSVKDKSKPNQESSETKRPPMQAASMKPQKVDACVQTSRESLPEICEGMIEDGYDTNHGSEDFPYDAEDSMKAPYWDLDIDSAIVGDFNSMSTFSLDEQIDPHYATIKVTADGKVIDKPQCVPDPHFFEPYPTGKISYPNSCTSSPKSGIYSKILKPRKSNEPNCVMSDYYRSATVSRLNFEKIMSIRQQLGLSLELSHNFQSCDSSVCTTDTPDIPLRNYGSSVINYVAKLRQHDSVSHSSCISSSAVYRDQKLSSANIYSPIWFTERSPAKNLREIPILPASEPVAPKRSMNRILHQLNPIYLDDSSEDASSISMNSPSKSKYSYPRDFSEHNCVVEDRYRLRHVTDNELEVRTSVHNLYRTGPVPPYHDTAPVARVPSQPLSSDPHCPCDEASFLQPLMERSCEEDYFKRDIQSYLDYVSV